LDKLYILSLIFGGKSFGGFGNYIRDVENYCRSNNIQASHIYCEELSPFYSDFVRFFSKALEWLIAMRDVQMKARKLNLANPLCMDVVASNAYPGSLTVVHGMLSKELATITKYPRIHKRLSNLGIRLPERQSMFMGKITGLEISGLRAARKIIVTNAQVGEYINRLSGVNAEHIPNPIDTKLFRPLDKTECKNRLGIPLDKKFILFYCNMYEKYSDRFAEWESVLLKHGFYVSNLFNNVRYDEMPLWYNASDLTVMPQRIIALGRFCLESLACGTPHLGTNNPLGNTSTVEALIDTIVTFGFNDVDRVKLRESVSEYSQDVIIPKLLEFHRKHN
jgi:glycosyltransferase involved in cell wall biosynthesis